MQFPKRWENGTISMRLNGIWGMPVEGHSRNVRQFDPAFEESYAMLAAIRNGVKYVLPASWSVHLRAAKHWLTGEPEIRILALICDRERASVDVGANVGIYSYFLRRHSTICYAMEPNPQAAPCSNWRRDIAGWSK